MFVLTSFRSTTGLAGLTAAAGPIVTGAEVELVSVNFGESVLIIFGFAMGELFGDVKFRAVTIFGSCREIGTEVSLCGTVGALTLTGFVTVLVLPFSNGWVVTQPANTHVNSARKYIFISVLHLICARDWLMFSLLKS